MWFLAGFVTGALVTGAAAWWLLRAALSEVSAPPRDDP